jgi:acetyl/propionyl-CoA carboxylase alpha subunit
MASETKNIMVKDDGVFVINDIKVKTGVFVAKGQILLTLKHKTAGNLIRIKADFAGKMVKVLKKAGQDVEKGFVPIVHSTASKVVQIPLLHC